MGSSSDENSTETFTDTSVAPDATQEEAPKTEEKLLF
jgi:hypothetical protein